MAWSVEGKKKNNRMAGQKSSGGTLKSHSVSSRSTKSSFVLAAFTPGSDGHRASHWTCLLWITHSPHGMENFPCNAGVFWKGKGGGNCLKSSQRESKSLKFNFRTTTTKRFKKIKIGNFFGISESQWLLTWRFTKVLFIRALVNYVIKFLKIVSKNTEHEMTSRSGKSITQRKYLYWAPWKKLKRMQQLI